MPDYTNEVIGAAIEVHRVLGPGLLESVYAHCLAIELREAGIPFEREKVLPAMYKGHELGCSYRLDFMVDNDLILELKTVDHLTKVHLAQVLTYLRLSSKKLGLLINFYEAVLKTGIRRVIF